MAPCPEPSPPCGSYPGGNIEPGSQNRPGTRKLPFPDNRRHRPQSAYSLEKPLQKPLLPYYTRTLPFGRVRRGCVLEDQRHIWRGNWDNPSRDYRYFSALDKTAAERNSRQILPAVLFLFAHKCEFADDDAAAALVLCPAVAGGQVSLRRQPLAA